MKRALFIIAMVMLAFCYCGCGETFGNNVESNEDNKVDTMNTDKMLVRIADNSFEVLLENNATTRAIKDWLGQDEKTVSASNYGGFEKILSLGKSFPTDNKQVSTSYGDVMLYSENQIVIFYEPNSWSYTRLGRVVGEVDLAKILSGSESEAKLSLIFE